MTSIRDSQEGVRFLERVRREHGSSWWTPYLVMTAGIFGDDVRKVRSQAGRRVGCRAVRHHERGVFS